MCLYLQLWSVLRLLLLHLLQQILKFFSQFSLKLRLNNKVQCSRKCGAQGVNMALQPNREKNICKYLWHVSYLCFFFSLFFMKGYAEEIQPTVDLKNITFIILYINCNVKFSLLCYRSSEWFILVRNAIITFWRTAHAQGNLQDHPICFSKIIS